MSNPQRRSSRLGVIAAVVAVIVSLGASARQAPLPTGREIVAKHAQAVGGEAAHKAVTSLRATGRLSIPSQNIAGDFEALSARPNKLVTRVTISGIGRIEGGYNGVVAWTVSPIAGPALLEGRELKEAADDAWFDSALYAADYVRDATTIARADFDGHAAYKVKVTFVSGRDELQYFDAESGLQIGTEGDRATPQGVIPTVHVLRDYKKFGDLLLPTIQIERALGFETITTIDTIVYNGVTAAAFDPPAEVKALIKQ